MRRLAVSDADLLRRVLRNAAELDPWVKLLHRLHCLVMVDAGQSCGAVGRCFNETPRTIQRWIQAYERHGIDGLRDQPRPGRRGRLAAAQRDALATALRQSPAALGYATAHWTGRTLAAHLSRACGVSLSVRQCQRLLRAAAVDRPCDSSSDAGVGAGAPSSSSVRPRRQ